MQSQSTTDYSLFKHIISNREVNEKHVKKLVAAISQRNMLHLNPINVNDKMQVIDGQHRLEAAKRLKVPVYYIVDGSITNADISILNTNKKNWELQDYLNFWCIEGRDDYKKVSFFMNLLPSPTPKYSSLIIRR